ncbi:hypothetical protein M438DRAFT_359405 [Aureobasidium pullulans EXF-150]|uniref:Uncharacterized protein n=1 Tax=Aureobasidium pullulans EXF-150 TaxID=1043002 RepID=A0A074X7M6_AURPU|nr:uncharacterized protein M438DRAFT_359405 [Aureobasidium pullulans EXF-150]KEQ79754.1 hypothetical protein M438DRAFT_359405 [Aureobasidium pullulans EXF-150]
MTVLETNISNDKEASTSSASRSRVHGPCLAYYLGKECLGTSRWRGDMLWRPRWRESDHKAGRSKACMTVGQSGVMYSVFVRSKDCQSTSELRRALLWVGLKFASRLLTANILEDEKDNRLCCSRFLVSEDLGTSHEGFHGSCHDSRVIPALRLCSVSLMAHQSPTVVNRGLDAKGQSVHSFGLKKRSLFKPFPGPTLVDVERDPQGFFRGVSSSSTPR